MKELQLNEEAIELLIDAVDLESMHCRQILHDLKHYHDKVYAKKRVESLEIKILKLATLKDYLKS